MSDVIDVARAEFCSVVKDNDCTNPPGYGNSAGHASNADGPRIKARCVCCGEAVCSHCRTGKRGAWICDNCTQQGYVIRPNGRPGMALAVRSNTIPVDHLTDGDHILHDGSSVTVTAVERRPGGFRVSFLRAGQISEATYVLDEHTFTRA